MPRRAPRGSTITAQAVAGRDDGDGAWRAVQQPVGRRAGEHAADAAAMAGADDHERRPIQLGELVQGARL
jgi:hypothetical protein